METETKYIRVFKKQGVYKELLDKIPYTKKNLEGVKKRFKAAEIKIF